MKIHELSAEENKVEDADRSSSAFSYGSSSSWWESDGETTVTPNSEDIPEFVYLWIYQHVGNINNSNNDVIAVPDGCDKGNNDENDENEDDVLHPSFLDLYKISTDELMRFSPQFESQETGTRKMSSSMAWSPDSFYDMDHLQGSPNNAAVRTVDYSSDFSSASQLTEKASQMSRYSESSRPATVLSWPLSTPRSDTCLWSPRSPVKSQKPCSTRDVETRSPDGDVHVHQTTKNHPTEKSTSLVKGEAIKDNHNWDEISQEIQVLPVSSHVCDSNVKSSKTSEIGQMEILPPPKKRVMKNVRPPTISSAVELESSNYKEEDFALPPLRNVSLELRHRKAGQEHDHHSSSRLSTGENVGLDSKQKGKTDTTEPAAKSYNSTRKKQKKYKERDKNEENVIVREKSRTSEEDPSGERPSSPKREKLKLPQIANMPTDSSGRTSIWHRILAQQSGTQSDSSPLVDCEPTEVNDNIQR